MPGSKKHNHGGKGKLEPRKVSATESSLSRLSISWFNSITIDIMWYLRYAKNKEVMTNLWNQISEIADFDKVLRSTFTFANPFSLFHIYFHCLSTTFIHWYPLSLSQIPFSLSCINFHFLRSPHALAQTFTFSSNCFFSSRTVKSTQRSLWGEWRPLARAKSIIILQNSSSTWIHLFFTLAKPQIS